MKRYAARRPINRRRRFNIVEALRPEAAPHAADLCFCWRLSLLFPAEFPQSREGEAETSSLVSACTTTPSPRTPDFPVSAETAGVSMAWPNSGVFRRSPCGLFAAPNFAPFSGAPDAVSGRSRPPLRRPVRAAGETGSPARRRQSSVLPSRRTRWTCPGSGAVLASRAARARVRPATPRR